LYVRSQRCPQTTLLIPTLSGLTIPFSRHRCIFGDGFSAYSAWIWALLGLTYPLAPRKHDREGEPKVQR
jgi:hypothetical protein